MLCMRLFWGNEGKDGKPINFTSRPMMDKLHGHTHSSIVFFFFVGRTLLE